MSKSLIKSCVGIITRGQNFLPDLGLCFFLLYVINNQFSIYVYLQTQIIHYLADFLSIFDKKIN